MIEYKDTHDFTKEQLERLFLSVEWSSGHFPDRLVSAMKKYDSVFTAWDGEKLVGLICALDDGCMNAYIHYLLVDPEHQHMSIGKTLIEMTKEKYKDYLRLVLIAYNTQVPFYERCGFKKEDKSSPMFITSLWT